MNIYDIRRHNVEFLIKDRFSGVQRQFAIAIKKEATVVGRWLSEKMDEKNKRKIGDDTARDIEQALGLDLDWMDHAHYNEWKSVYLIFNEGRAETAVRENVQEYRARQIPVIAQVEAGAWHETGDYGHIETWLPCPPNCDERNTFALMVSGPSMDDGTAKGYREGEFVFVDASLTTPEHNADVIVRNGDGKVTFKRLIHSDGNWYLKPLNPNWPEPIIHFSENCHLIGRVMFSGQTRN